jgi:uncharacterized membrane protein
VTIQIPPTLNAVEPGQPLALTFNLYRGNSTDNTSPYRSLRLFINVDDQTSAP